MSTTGSWASISMLDRLDRVLGARSASRRRTIAIGSPTNRTSPSASTRNGRVHPSSGPSPSTNGSSTRWLRSEATNTAAMPGIDAARVVSIARGFPWRCRSRERRVQRAGERDVVDVATAAGEEASVLLSRHALTHEPGTTRHPSRSSPEPRSAALRPDVWFEYRIGSVNPHPDVSDITYDPYDVDISANPFPVFRRLRDEAPLYYNERHDFYAVSRADDVERVLVDWQTFSNSKSPVLEFIKSGIEFPPAVFLFTDPPRHTMYRGLLSRVFTPKRVRRSTRWCVTSARVVSTRTSAPAGSTSCATSAVRCRCR